MELYNTNSLLYFTLFKSVNIDFSSLNLSKASSTSYLSFASTMIFKGEFAADFFIVTFGYLLFIKSISSEQSSKPKYIFLPNALFAFLNLINPVISVIYGYTGFTMEKVDESFVPEKAMEA